MSITDELRKWGYGFCGDTHDVVTAIADRIDAAYEGALVSSYFDGVFSDGELAENGFIRLPVDADGEIIHVGDMMERGKSRGHVIALMLSEYPKKWGEGLHWAVQLEGEQAPTALDVFFHHYHEPTVKNVLREMLAMAGCKLHEDGSCEMGLTDKQIDEYAAKLRLADDKEQQ